MDAVDDQQDIREKACEMAHQEQASPPPSKSSSIQETVRSQIKILRTHCTTDISRLKEDLYEPRKEKALVHISSDILKTQEGLKQLREDFEERWKLENSSWKEYMMKNIFYNMDIVQLRICNVEDEIINVFEKLSRHLYYNNMGLKKGTNLFVSHSNETRRIIRKQKENPELCLINSFLIYLGVEIWCSRL